MANSSLLTLFQHALQGMGVQSYGQPTTIVGNTNQDITQMLALINMEADSQAREHEWQAQRIQYNFSAATYSYTGTTTTDSANVTGMSSITGLGTTFMLTGTGVPQDTFVTEATGTTVTMNRAATASGTGTFTFSQVLFSFPTGYDRPVDRTQWDKSKHWEMLGPETPQQMEWLRSGYISTGPRIRFIDMGGYFMIWPPLGSAESLSYEYQSKYWIVATGATTPTKQYFTVDTDTCIFPDALMHALIRLKYFEIKGFDTTALYRDYIKQLDLAKSYDAGNRTLSMAPRLADVLIGWENIPDSNYGSN